MKNSFLIGLSLIVVYSTISALAGDTEYKKGESWTYEVKGPRTWTDENVYGDRKISVDTVNDSGYTIEDEWGSWDDNAHVISLNKDGMQTKLEIGYDFSLNYKTPIPFNFIDLLKVDEEKDFGTANVEMDGFSVSLTTKVKRLKDEDVTVPAGEFKGSQKYEVTNVLSFSSDQGERVRKMNRQIWVHKDANGIVKDAYEHQALSQDAGDTMFKGESLLKKHEVKSE